MNYKSKKRILFLLAMTICTSVCGQTVKPIKQTDLQPKVQKEEIKIGGLTPAQTKQAIEKSKAATDRAKFHGTTKLNANMQSIKPHSLFKKLVEVRNDGFVKAPFISPNFYYYPYNYDSLYDSCEAYLSKKYSFGQYKGIYPNISLSIIDMIALYSRYAHELDKEAAWCTLATPIAYFSKDHYNNTCANSTLSNREEPIVSHGENHTEQGAYYNWAKIKSNVEHVVPDIVFVAHLDVERVSVDSVYRDSIISVIYNYDGGDVLVTRGSQPPQSKEIFSVKGNTIITSNGHAPINVDGVAGCTVLETLLGQLAFSYYKMQHGNVYFVVCGSKADMYSSAFHDTICNRLGCNEETIMIALDGDSKNSFLTTDTGLASKLISESAAENGYVWTARGIDIAAEMKGRSWSNIYCGKHAAHTPYEWLCVEELVDLVKITRSIVTKVAESK